MGGRFEPGSDDLHAGSIADLRSIRSERRRHARQHSIRVGGRRMVESADLRAASERGDVYSVSPAVRSVRSDPGGVRRRSPTVLNAIAASALLADAGNRLFGVLRYMDPVVAEVAWRVYEEESTSVCVGNASSAEMSARAL